MVENMGISRIWKYTRENVNTLDKEVVGFLSYNSKERGLMKRLREGRRIN
jgi:hypothetical protein